MKKAFFVEIRPTEAQKKKIHQTIGTCRYVYNLYVAKVKEQYEAGGHFLTGFTFSKWLNNVHTKQTDFWIKETSSKATKQAIMNGERAFREFFAGKNGYPRFKRKSKQDVKCYFPKNNPTDWTVERHRVKIPTLGWMRLKEYGYIPKHVTVTSGTVSFRAGRYYVSVLCEAEQSVKTVELKEKGLGVDLGLASFAVTDEEIFYGNVNKTKTIKKLEKALRREQRSLSRKYENIKKRGDKSATKRANIDKNVYRVQRLYQRLVAIRAEYVKSVVHDLVKAKPNYITIEDLNIKGMLKNRHLSKAVASQCFYLFNVWLLAKCQEHGIELRQVNRFYPSSKKCAGCGHIKSRLKISERVYYCEACGRAADRDVNAAMNLLQATVYKVLTA
ncbi:MAG: transposase [Solibacillus sp.]